MENIFLLGEVLGALGINMRYLNKMPNVDILRDLIDSRHLRRAYNEKGGDHFVNEVISFLGKIPTGAKVEKILNAAVDRASFVQQRIPHVAKRVDGTESLSREDKKAYRAAHREWERAAKNSILEQLSYDQKELFRQLKRGISGPFEKRNDIFYRYLVFWMLEYPIRSEQKVTIKIAEAELELAAV